MYAISVEFLKSRNVSLQQKSLRDAAIGPQSLRAHFIPESLQAFADSLFDSAKRDPQPAQRGASFQTAHPIFVFTSLLLAGGAGARIIEFACDPPRKTIVMKIVFTCQRKWQ
jgi:hypothetical protein